MKAAFFTLGCKVNQYETEILKAQFAKNGFTIVPHSAAADVFVLNSCTVTAGGDKKTRQTLRRFRRENPTSVIAVIGCYPQAFPDDAKLLSDADIIMGAQNRHAVLDQVRDVLKTRKKVVDITRYSNGTPFEPMQASSFSEHTRAFVKIEDGCDRYCSYCIIPKARGPVRSKPLSDLKEELTSLSENGYKEVVLVGINLSSYGKGADFGLADAVELANSIPKIERVRLGSLEPELLTDDDLARMASCEKFCPQFHLSLQSGCDQTLKRMRRHYTSQEYADIVDKIRANFENVSITTDIMVGFAGETDEEFLKSVEFAKKIGFAKTHVFAYSVREGTKAAQMDCQVPPEVKDRRSAEMIAVTDKLREDFLQTQISLTESVLFETCENGKVCGYTKNYSPVEVQGPKELCGTIQNVRITGILKDRCVGELV